MINRNASNIELFIYAALCCDYVSISREEFSDQNWQMISAKFW